MCFIWICCKMIQTCLSAVWSTVCPHLNLTSKLNLLYLCLYLILFFYHLHPPWLLGLLFLRCTWQPHQCMNNPNNVNCKLSEAVHVCLLLKNWGLKWPQSLNMLILWSSGIATDIKENKAVPWVEALTLKNQLKFQHRKCKHWEGLVYWFKCKR